MAKWNEVALRALIAAGDDLCAESGAPAVAAWERAKRVMQGRDQRSEPAPDEEDESGSGTLLALALAAVVGALLWVGIILAIRWVLQLPPPSLVRLGAVAGLVGGSVLIFVALVRMELSIRPTPDRSRGRRPARGVAPPGAARASSGESAPPQAGGRALPPRRPA